MHIMVDGRMISNTGIGRWIQNIVTHLVKIKSDHKITVLVNRDSERVRSFGIETRRLHFSAPAYSLREQMLLPLELRSGRPDVVHYPNFNLALADRTPAVLTLCDLIYYLFPQACPSWIGHQYARWMIRMAARKARRIITLSEYSKRDMVRHLGCPESKIAVIYPAIDCAVFHDGQKSATVAAATHRLGIQKPYIFYTGNHEPRKNLALLVDAYRKLAKRKQYQLVLGGHIDSRRQAFYDSIHDLVASGDVILCGEIAESDLPLLYAGAELFVFPSTYEGFGLPPLESMAAGVPVVCSSSTSLPEVVGDAAITFDPQSLDDLLKAMNLVLGSKQLAGELREKGRQQVQRFSWQTAAERAMGIYQEVAQAG
jgi:glycosyltransferase involved in cell wall biosynthesis